MLLEVDQINTYRGPAHILHGVSISVNEKELVCMVGRNGAGRTTIIESITGLLPVRSGQVRFRGEDITRLPAHQRAAQGIGYAPENSGIFPELSVSENLMISRWLAENSGRDNSSSGDAEARVFTVFPEVRNLLSRQGISLSGGQRKMVAIARAMALCPYLLILDEAFEGLAPVVVRRLREAVEKIKEMGISILIGESNLVRAVAMADRLYVVDRGEIIFHGAPQEVLNNEEVMRTVSG